MRRQAREQAILMVNGSRADEKPFPKPLPLSKVLTRRAEKFATFIRLPGWNAKNIPAG
jgi:hypothetical protein